MSTEQTEKFQWIFDDCDRREQSSLLEITEAEEIVGERSENHDSITIDPLPLHHSAQDFVEDEVAVAESRNVSESLPVRDSATADFILAQNDGVGDTTAAFPPVPERIVNTAPRPVTIVWGFVVMALGILAITLAAGAAVDLGLVFVWLPAICGIALILAAILAATSKNRSASRV